MRCWAFVCKPTDPASPCGKAGLWGCNHSRVIFKLEARHAAAAAAAASATTAMSLADEGLDPVSHVLYPKWEIARLKEAPSCLADPAMR